jgi:septum formation protein
VRPIVLGSTSPWRAAILRRLGIAFSTAAPPFDETPAHDESPRETAIRFAEGKARSLRRAHPRSLVIGADQTLELDGRLLRKPRDRAETSAQLEALSGRSHALHAAISILDTDAGELTTDVVTITLTMRDLSRAKLERYVELDRPSGVVGGYTFEARGACLFARVEGGDESAIVGLPVPALTRCFAALGIEILDLCGPG